MREILHNLQSDPRFDTIIEPPSGYVFFLISETSGNLEKLIRKTRNTMKNKPQANEKKQQKPTKTMKIQLKIIRNHTDQLKIMKTHKTKQNP